MSAGANDRPDGARGSRRSARLFRRAAIFVALFLALRLFCFHVARVTGDSMADSLNSGDLVLVTLFDYRLGEPERGDVVECRFPGREGRYIKRLIGLPGERVEIADGRTYIDGVPLSEPYVTSPTEDYALQLGPDEYLLLGDNRSASYDSRAEDMGPIHRSDFIGRVRCALWPMRNLK